MSIQKFQDPQLSDYFYDRKADQVFSTKSGQTRPMKWSQQRSWYPKRVGMVTARGYKVSYTRDQILKMLKPVEQQAVRQQAQPQAITNDLTLLRPDYEYVLYSVQNRCSQYFFAGTSVQEALDRFAKRGECIRNEDIRILNTQSGKISKLVPQQVVTYALV